MRKDREIRMPLWVASSLIAISLLGDADLAPGCVLPDTTYGKKMTLSFHPRQMPIGIHYLTTPQGYMVGEGNWWGDIRPRPQLLRPHALFTVKGSTVGKDQLFEGDVPGEYCVWMRDGSTVGLPRIESFDKLPR